MPLHHNPPAGESRLLTRRRMLAMTGAALTPLLIACGDEDEPEDVPDQVDPPSAPDLDPEEPGMDAPNETPQPGDG